MNGKLYYFQYFGKTGRQRHISQKERKYSVNHGKYGLQPNPSVYDMRASEPASHASQHASHASQHKITLFFSTQLFLKENVSEMNRSLTSVRVTSLLKPFQYTHFTSSHPVGVKRGFIKGEALRLLRTNSSETTFDESISNFKSRLITRGYPHEMIQMQCHLRWRKRNNK